MPTNDTDYIREYMRKYRQEKANREYTRTYQRNYRQTAEGKLAYSNSNNKRRAIITDAGSYTLQEWNMLLDQYNHTCLRCGCNDCKLTVDHIKPLSKGGDNTINNIQPLCSVCNSSKSGKTMDYR